MADLGFALPIPNYLIICDLRGLFRGFHSSLRHLGAPFRDFRAWTGTFRGLVGDFCASAGVFRGRTGKNRGRMGDFRGTMGTFRGLTRDFCGPMGTFRGRAGELQGMAGEQNPNGIPASSPGLRSYPGNRSEAARNPNRGCGRSG
jgi:hypothetical protein